MDLSRYNVCTSPWDPIVTCDPADPPALYDGYQLFRRIADEMGWSDSDWVFTCIDWTPMIEDIMSPDGLCTMAAAGVEMSLENVAAGMKMSWPIYKSGFQVMTAGSVRAGGTWTFAEAFHWGVWAALGGTALAISLLVAVVEYFTFGSKDNRKGLQGWSWYSWAQMMHIHSHTGDPATWGARVLMLAYGFLIVIMVHLYTATLASRLTQQRLANDINSKADLPGKPVQTWESYQGLLRKYSIDAAGLPWESDEDTAAFIGNLRNNTYKARARAAERQQLARGGRPLRAPRALVLDAPVISYLVGTMNDLCDLYAVGEPFETFDLAIGFPPDAPDPLINDISKVIVRLQTERGVLDELENRYITKAQGGVSCDSSSGSHSGGRNVVVHLEQVAGLWIILSITTGIGLVLALISVLKRRMRARAAAAGGGGGSRGGGAPAAGALEPSTPKWASFWGETMSFKRRSSSGTDSEPGTHGPPSPVRRSSIVSRFAAERADAPAGLEAARVVPFESAAAQAALGPGGAAWQPRGARRQAAAIPPAEAEGGQ
ncbi:MAG: hypothetical protein J3K34DRAFT_495859 [Monoraphidium minutum]|nr:MAG: hypothetical protein J3K34DRAFT_495859 [Monoraphidium minutum]